MIKLILLVLLIIIVYCNFTSAAFSGLYKPNTTISTEDYGGAWLASIDKFEDIRNWFHMMVNIEHGTLAMTLTGHSGTPKNIMTRDFFDFLVIHLSSTTNTMPHDPSSEIKSILIDRMKDTVGNLSSRVKPFGALYQKISSLNQTVAILPYSSTPASSQNDEFNRNIRKYYFQATFWSIYKYFRNVLITTSSNEELEQVKTFGLPAWKYVNVMPDEKFPANKKNKWHLPRETLRYVLQNIDEGRLNKNSDAAWNNCRYLYYSEGDLILQMRFVKALYNVIDRHNKTLVLVPHRMQSITLPKTFPKEIQRLWSHKKVQNLESMKLVTEEYLRPKGSCCENGRLVFPSCGNWWYNCEDFGLQNYTTWIRFGANAFTMPLATEHGATCRYSRRRGACPLPAQQVGCKRGHICEAVHIPASNE